MSVGCGFPFFFGGENEMGCKDGEWVDGEDARSYGGY